MITDTSYNDLISEGKLLIALQKTPGTDATGACWFDDFCVLQCF